MGERCSSSAHWDCCGHLVSQHMSLPPIDFQGICKVQQARYFTLMRESFFIIIISCGWFLSNVMVIYTLLEK